MVPDVASSAYGYYPRLMVRLSAVAYESMGGIPAAVEELAHQVVCG